MQKWFSVLGILLVASIAAPDHAYSRGGGGGGGRRFNNDDDTPAKATPTPAPAPATVQGTIIGVTPFAVSVQVTPQAPSITFKVGNTSSITLNGRVVGVNDLKPGMIATIKPMQDNVYANTITATLPAPVAPPDAGSSTAAAPQRPSVPSVPSSAPAASTGGGSYFGQRNNPY